MAGRVATDRRSGNSAPPTWFQQAYKAMPDWKKTAMTVVGFAFMLAAAGVLVRAALVDAMGFLVAVVMGTVGFVGLFLAFPKGAIYLLELSPRIAGVFRKERRSE